MSAREMFESLGYNECKQEYEYLVYRKVVNDIEICFDLIDCVFDKRISGFYCSINAREINAIYKQIQELGWLEDEGH